MVDVDDVTSDTGLEMKCNSTCCRHFPELEKRASQKTQKYCRTLESGDGAGFCSSDSMISTDAEEKGHDEEQGRVSRLFSAYAVLIGPLIS